jgi:hypothetical protein
VKRNPYSVVLLDEIEKAHPDLFNILLQVFEDGHLTDGLGNRVNFKNTIIIMTSNIGARFIQKKASLGFQSTESSVIARSVNDMVLGEVRKTFNPEFINRIDEIIVFEALSDDDLRTITRLLVKQLNDNLVDRKIRSTLAPEWSTGSSSRPARTARTARVRCAAPSSATSKTRCPRSSFAGTSRRRDRGLPRRRVAGLPSRRPARRTAARLTLSPQRNPIQLRRDWAQGRVALRPNPVKSWLGVPRHAAAGLARSRRDRRLMLKFRAFVAPAALAGRRAPPAQPPAAAARRQRGPPAPAAQTVPTVGGCDSHRPRTSPRGIAARRLSLFVPCSRSRADTRSSCRDLPVLPADDAARQLAAGNKWVPYDDKIEQIALGDFKRLLATNFLDDPRHRRPGLQVLQGVIGKMIVYDMEERQRVKIVDYVGSKKVEQSKIDDELKKQNLRIALDSFIDQGLIRKVAGVVRGLYADKGYEYVEVKPEVKPVNSGTKTVNVTFHITEGPKVRIRAVDFQGNKAMSDGKLNGKMKENKSPNKWLKFISGGGTYNEGKFEEDADKVQAFYRENGYVKAQVGQPELKILEDSQDGKSRWVQLQIPVTEGPALQDWRGQLRRQYRHQDRGAAAAVQGREGRVVQREEDPQGLREGARGLRQRGYFEFTGVPILVPERSEPTATAPAPAAAPPAAPRPPARGEGEPEPIVNVTMRSRKASSTSSTASSSSATRRRATTSSAARCGCSRAACSTPRR